MTIFTSSMISGAVGQQLQYFGGTAGYAQQLSYPMQQAMYPGMAPPMMPQFGAMGAAQRGHGGMYGEQAAMRMASVGQTAMNVGMSGLGMMSAFSPIPMDPFSGALMGARFGLGGAALGAAGGATIGLPLFAAQQAAQIYGGAFVGGIQDQGALNSTLRNNFQHMGGQGAMGRGFSQQQMGQIGGVISGELRRNPFTSASEMNSLISGGAESGMFTAVRDVQQFTQKFRQMLNTLKDVQRELGGTLTDALQFVRGAQQSGIFRQADQVNFAAEVRGAEAVTGMDRNQLIALSATGAQISRSFGGMGRQGAMGALRGAQTLGAAISSGAVNQEQLSEATGGLQGAEAISAFTTNMLQRSGRFSHSGMGRFSLFAMSNAQGTGLDQDMMQRFMAGDLSTSEVSGAAHRRVGGMGRARALNREGMLRGAVMEQGGMAAQIGMMRLMVGDRVLDQGDDMASLVMQRRFHMSRPESELMTSLMRNQGSIAEREAIDRAGASRQTAIQREVTENRSIDAFGRQLSHGMQDAFGVTKARELGRDFMSRLSTLTERAMNDILGVASSSMSQGDHQGINRLMMGRASSTDLSRLTVRAGMSGGTGESLFGGRSAGQQILHSLGMGESRTQAEVMEARGVHNFRRLDGVAAREAMQGAMDARTGFVTGRDRDQLRMLEADTSATVRRIQMSQIMAQGMGDASDFYRFMGRGVSANATDAFMARQGLANNGLAPDRGSMLLAGRGGGRIDAGMVGRDILRGGALLGGLLMAPLSGGTSLAVGAGLAFGTGGFETLGAVSDRRDDAMASFIASGGHAGADARRVAGGMHAYRAREMVEGGAFGEMRAGSREQTQVRAALIGQGLQADQGAVSSLLGSESTQNRLRRMSGMTDRGQLMSELEIFRREASQIQDPAQAQAARTMAMQLERNIRTNGRIGREFDPGLSDSERRRQNELLQEFGERGANMRGLANRLDDAGGGQLAGLLRGSARMFNMDSNGITREDLGVANTNMMAFQGTLSRMDTSSEEYRRITGALGRDEFGQAQLAGAANQRQLRRALSGQGRRGYNQAVETAFGAVTGNSLSGMEFDLGGGRSISGGSRNAAQRLAGILSRGGADASSIQNQLITNLTGQGVGSEEASSMVNSLTSGLMGRSGRGLGREQIEQLIQGSGSEAMQAIQRRQTEQQQRARDPIAFDSLQELRTISGTMREIRDNLPGATGGPAPEPAS